MLGRVLGKGVGTHRHGAKWVAQKGEMFFSKSYAEKRFRETRRNLQKQIERGCDGLRRAHELKDPFE